jgi:hypothetical protein
LTGYEKSHDDLLRANSFVVWLLPRLPGYDRCGLILKFLKIKPAIYLLYETVMEV